MVHIKNSLKKKKTLLTVMGVGKYKSQCLCMPKHVLFIGDPGLPSSSNKLSGGMNQESKLTALCAKTTTCSPNAFLYLPLVPETLTLIA